MQPPKRLDVRKDEGLSVEWGEGGASFYPVGYLRRMSPSAEMRELRKEMERNPLTVLPSGMGGGGALRIVDAELVGNYAVRLRFSDGHDTGLYTWEYLREIDPSRGAEDGA